MLSVIDPHLVPVLLSYYCLPAGEPGPQSLDSYLALIWCAVLQGVAKGLSSKLTILSGHGKKRKYGFSLRGQCLKYTHMVPRNKPR